MTAALRKADRADVAQLVELARQTYFSAFGHTFTPGDLAAHLAIHLSDSSVEGWLHEDTVLLAETQGRLVGFAHFGAAPPGRYGGLPSLGALAIHRLYVAADLQGAGIGTKLLKTALAMAGDHPNTDIYLDVWEENHGAQRLYGRHGFSSVGRVLFETESGAGAGYDIVMVRRRR